MSALVGLCCCCWTLLLLLDFVVVVGLCCCCWTFANFSVVGDHQRFRNDEFKHVSRFDDMYNDLYRPRDPFVIFLLVLLLVLFVTGLTGNIFVIFVVVRHSCMRTMTNLFFINLTIGDVLVVCVCLPATAGNYINRDWVFGNLLCKVSPFFMGTAVGVSVLSLTLICVNRYIATHKPLQARFLFIRKRVTAMVIAIWVVSISAVIPLLFVNSVTTYGVAGVFEARVCEERWGSRMIRQLYNLLIFSLLFMLPLAIMIVFYTRISLTLRKTNTSQLVIYSANETPARNISISRIVRQRRKTVRVLIVLVILFAMSWFPYYFVNVWLDAHDPATISAIVMNYVYPLVQVVQSMHLTHCIHKLVAHWLKIFS